MLSPFTPVLVSPQVDYLAATRKHIKARSPRTPYSAGDVDAITWAYAEVCGAGQVDLEFALTMMVHETGGLTSDWSQPPKRNPAGIGVTGANGADGQPFGQFFSSWPEAVMCHVGLLLAYNFPAGQGTTAQKSLIDFAVKIRPGVPRGVGTTLAEVAAKWAADPEYANKLTSLAKVIRTGAATTELRGKDADG